MELNSTQVQYIKSKKNVLQRNDFDTFFSEINANDRHYYADFFYSIGINIFDFMKTVPDALFFNSTELTAIDIPQNISSIGVSAFQGCSKLESVSMADSVVSIGTEAFADCFNLKQVKLSNNLQGLPKKCFRNDTSLKEIFLPDSVRNLQADVFSGCDDIIIRANYRKDVDKRLRIKQGEVEFYRTHIKFNHPKEQTQESLREQLILTEDFSPSMPKWLRARLMYTKTDNNYYDRQKTATKIQQQYPDYSFQPHATFTSKKRQDQTYEDLWDAMRRAGIDISNATFIQDGSPRLRGDSRLDAPNFAFFYLDDGSVYGTRLNDNEIFGPEDKAFKSVPLKTLIAHMKDFCWLDGTDTNNFNASKIQNRGELNRELKSIPGYYRYKNVDDAGIRWSDQKLDKSGYIIDPKRFKDKLIQLGKKNLAKNLEKLYKEVIDIQREMSYVLADYDFRDPDSDFQDVFGINSRSLMYDLSTVHSLYNSAARSAKNASVDVDNKDYYESQAARYIEKTKEAIKKLRKSGEKIFSVDVDWDTNESLRRRYNEAVKSNKARKHLNHLTSNEDDMYDDWQMGKIGKFNKHKNDEFEDELPFECLEEDFTLADLNKGDTVDILGQGEYKVKTKFKDGKMKLVPNFEQTRDIISGPITYYQPQKKHISIYNNKYVLEGCQKECLDESLFNGVK